jgi:hypothetical protein
MALLLLLFVVTTAEECITVNDDAVVSVDIQNVTGTYPVTVGTTTFNSCDTTDPDDYIDQEIADIVGARLVDIKVSTAGTYDGNLTNGSLTVNGTEIMGYSGSWSAFATPQSLLTSELLTRNPAGVTALVNAVTAGAPITVCGSGTLSPAAVAGMSVVIEVFAQADVTP